MALSVKELLRVGRTCPLFRHNGVNLAISRRQLQRGKTVIAIEKAWDGIWTSKLVTSITQSKAWTNFREWYGLNDHVIDLGDYPRLPAISNQELPTHGWWDNYELRNKNTILHENYDALSVFVFDIFPNRGYQDDRPWVRVAETFLMISFIGLLYLISYLYIKFDDEVDELAKHFPFGNLYLEQGGDATVKGGYFPAGPAMGSSLDRMM